MFHFLGYKLATGVVVFIGEQTTTNELEGVRKSYAICTKDSNGTYTRNLTPDVFGEVYKIDNAAFGAEEIDDCIELVNNKYAYSDSQSYGDMNHGFMLPSATLVGGEWVEVPLIDLLDKKVMLFDDYVNSIT